jgi:hypothetical protein
MRVWSGTLEFRGQPITIEEIQFGECLYVYIGPDSRPFDDLSLTFPNPVASSRLLGQKVTDEFGPLISELTQKPVLVSYSFPLETEIDAARSDFVKLSLRRRYGGK